MVLGAWALRGESESDRDRGAFASVAWRGQSSAEGWQQPPRVEMGCVAEEREESGYDGWLGGRVARMYGPLLHEAAGVLAEGWRRVLTAPPPMTLAAASAAQQQQQQQQYSTRENTIVIWERLGVFCRVEAFCGVRECTERGCQHHARAGVLRILLR